MKKRFTILMAAMMLLVTLAIPMGMWGQTRDEVVTYTLDGTITGGDNGYATESTITQNSVSWKVTGNTTMSPWRLGGKSLNGVDRPLYSTTTISDNISKIEVTHGAASSITVNSWTVIVSKNSDFSSPVSTLTPTFAANSTTTINRPDGADWSNCYYKFVYNVSVSADKNKFLEFSEAKFYKETGTTLQDSDLSLSPTALTFDLFDDAEAKTITISTSSTGAISVSNNAYVSTAVNGIATISVTPVAVTPEAQTITVSQAADNTYNAGEATFTVSVANSTPTYSVTYKANGGTGDDVVDTYYQGEDVTVRSNTFVYTGHAFTKWNTAANGSGTDYQPEATIENIQANVELYAQWEESNEVVDVLTNSNTIGETTSSYGDWTATGTSGAEYSGNSAGSNGTIQLRSNNSNSGIVSTVSGGLVKKVVVTWNSGTSTGRTLNVYGNNTEYTNASDLYGNNAGTLLGTIVCGTSTELTITDDYKFIGLRSESGAMYLEEIRITWEPNNNPAVATTTTINDPANFNTDIYQGTTAGTLTATVKDNENNVISGATVTWSSSNTGVATIDDNGAVTLVAVGTTTITASYAGVEDQYRPSTGTYELEVTDSTPIGDLVIDFESATTAYTNWTFTNMTSQQTGDITAHGGTYYGTTGGKETASITTESKIATPYTLTCYVSKQSGNTTASTWYIQVSSDGTTWTDVASRSAIDMSKGEWKEFTANLSSYTNVYVRVYYDGTTAVRNIDDLTLLTSVPSVIAPTFSPAEGLYTSAQNVTISTTTPGATIYYTLDGTDPTTSSSVYSSPINVSSTTTIKAMAVASGNQSSIVSATYTIELPLSTMDQIFAKATEVGSTPTTVHITLGDWVVTGANTSSHTFVSDGTKGFMIYGSNHGFSAGDVLSGTVECKVQLYNGAAEITQLNSTTTGLTVTPNGTVTAANIALADLAGINTGALVSYQNLTCEERVEGEFTNYYLSDGTTEIQAYKTLLNDYADYLEDGKTYNITGVFVLNNETKRINPRSADDIVELVPTTINLAVPGYGTSAGGYHLIASPLATRVAPTAVTNMIDATPKNYDLYRFNQDEDIEWQNYKGHTEDFVIEPGKAYLYAHNTDVTLTFNGIAYNGNGTFTLTQSTTNNASNGGKMNALGNPYNAPASIGSRSFYKMNAAGTALETVVGGTIGALEGIVVNYDANNPTVTFSTSKSRDVIELLTLNLQEQDNVIDNVIVRFDGGDQLLKYQIFDSSKIYFTVDGEDYAVVRGENQGTLPVNFVALSNGTYTISMDFENMTFSYLHLIDNLTGEDIDMLTTTSYSFDATTEDDANRFTLVYSKDGEDTTETLTFYDGDTSSSYVPVYGFYADAYQKVEFIMPTDDLSELNGGTINKMTWYLTTPAEVAWGGNFKIYLMETEETTPADYADLTNATLVYDGPLDGTGETLEINFATGFLYEGDNLLVAVHQTETGTYKSATFAGSAVTGAALQGYNYSSLDQVNQFVRDFLPKTTFEFTPSSGAVYYKPKQLQASEIGLTSAVLTWVAGDDETSWGVEYRKVTEDTWTDAGTVDQLTITLDNLEAGTEYEAHVKSIYTDGESGWTTIAFATEACEETDKGEVAYSLTDTYGDGWNNNKLRIFLSGTDIMIAELTITTGSELEGVVKLCYDTDYDLVWVAGSYAYETGFVLTAPDGTIIYEYHGTGSSSGGTTPTPGVLTTFQIHNGFTKTIKAYTDNSGYYLIASPVGNVLASNVTNMVDGNYDLYMFDQTGDDEGKQWLNYKANAFSYLEVGLGYLYASESNVTLSFSGTPISSDDDYAVEVNYNASSDFPGLNLLGNPFAEEAYLVNAEGNGLAYHRLNPTNNTYVTVDDNSAIPMMEGVFYEAGENDVVVYFSATAPATSKSNLNITVSQGRGMVDNAIVRFGEGNTLRKISLRDNSTKVYIPQNGSEYALVNANEFGEMPVNFKAESNGTYTMSFSNHNVEFGYLHLIDNLTGADVDLLANPSYSFEAKVSDYASRFKLVFATGNDDSSSDFAFVSNDEIIVNGEGMLQVIDMTGRVIAAEQINGVSNIKLNAAAGVYVLRLNDKTQKIVIR